MGLGKRTIFADEQCSRELPLQQIDHRVRVIRLSKTEMQCVCVCVCVCVCERERERERRERQTDRQTDRQTENVCVCEKERDWTLWVSESGSLLQEDVALDVVCVCVCGVCGVCVVCVCVPGGTCSVNCSLFQARMALDVRRVRHLPPARRARLLQHLPCQSECDPV